MVGFANMWDLGEGAHSLEAALTVWKHVQDFYRDKEHGEWFWYSTRDLRPEDNGYKAGAWKAPYHNGRAMLMMYPFLA